MTTAAQSNALYPSRGASGALLGRQLSQRCASPIVVLGVTPTGVEVAASASKALNCAFDVIVGAHLRMEGLGIVGAMAEDADAVVDREFQPRFGLIEAIDAAIDRARRAIKTERLLFRGQRPLRSVAEATAVIMDGHVTSPWKALAAARALEQMEPRKILIAAAVSTQDVKDRISAAQIEFLCPSVLLDPTGHPLPFGDPQDPSAERLRSIVVARQAA